MSDTDSETSSGSSISLLPTDEQPPTSESQTKVAIQEPKPKPSPKVRKTIFHRQYLSFQQQKALIDEFLGQKKLKRDKFAKLKNIPRSTFQRWVENKEAIAEKAAAYGKHTTRLRMTTFALIDDKLFDWFNDMRARVRKVPIPFFILHSTALKLIEKTYPDSSSIAAIEKYNEQHRSELLNRSSGFAFEFESDSDPEPDWTEEEASSEDTDEWPEEEIQEGATSSSDKAEQSSSSVPRKSKRRIRTEPEEEPPPPPPPELVQDVKEAESLLRALSDGLNDSTPRGIHNYHRYCFIISILQQLFMHVQFRETILHWPVCFPTFLRRESHLEIPELPHLSTRIGLWKSLWNLFLELSLKRSDPCNIEPFLAEYSELGDVQSPLEPGDPAELLRVLIDTLDQSLSDYADEKHPSFIGKFFHHKVRTYSICPHSHNTITTVNEFSITINPYKSKGLIQALHEFTKVEKVEYVCERCKTSSADTAHFQLFTHLPNTLVFTLLRGHQTVTAEKTVSNTMLTNYFWFPVDEYLSMAEFTVEGTYPDKSVIEYQQLMAKYEEAVEISDSEPETEEQKRTRKGVMSEEDFANLFKAGKKESKPKSKAKAQSKPQTQSEQKVRRKKKVDASVIMTKNRIMQDGEYSLQGIVCHAGRGVEDGHYFSMIKDRETFQWYFFSDTIVEPLSSVDVVKALAYGIPEKECDRTVKQKMTAQQRAQLKMFSAGTVLIYERVHPRLDWSSNAQAARSPAVPHYSLHPSIDDERNEYTSYIPITIFLQEKLSKFVHKSKVLFPTLSSSISPPKQASSTTTHEEQTSKKEPSVAEASTAVALAADESAGDASAGEVSAGEASAGEASDAESSEDLTGESVEEFGEEDDYPFYRKSDQLPHRKRKKKPEIAPEKLKELKQWRNKYLCKSFEDIEPEVLTPDTQIARAVTNWLIRWIKRRGIRSRVMTGESGSATDSVKQDWIRKKLRVSF